MRQTFIFAESFGSVTCTMLPGEKIQLPVVPGLLKYPTRDMLPGLLMRPEVARKYTREALRNAAWPILRLFSRYWLRKCLPEAGLKTSRARALEFLLSS